MKDREKDPLIEAVVEIIGNMPENFIGNPPINIVASELLHPYPNRPINSRREKRAKNKKKKLKNKKL
jgi:hypothetical protein